MSAHELWRVPSHYTPLPGWPDWEAFMSNFDGSIDRDAELRLKSGPFRSWYAAWAFNGKVWWDCEQKQWACEVWVHHRHVETIFAETTDELMHTVSEQYGYE